jgi:iron complex transport system substrate-binding protein
MGIPVYVVYPRNVAETLETIRRIGRVTGVPDAGKRLAGSIEARIAVVQKRISTARRPVTLECVMLQPLTVAGPETFVDDLIRLAGGRNAVPPGPSRYPTWNSEALLSADPEMIVVSAYPGQPDPSRFFDRWPQLRAVREKQIIQIEADWIHRPGPRMILAIETLARALHPEIPSDD